MAVGNLDSFRLAWVQSFLAVDEMGSETAAARAIGCSQSTVSRALADLSTFLGGDLFEGATSLQLTALGKAFLPEAEALLYWARECRKLKDKVSALEPELATPLPKRTKARAYLKGLYEGLAHRMGAAVERSDSNGS